MSVAIAVDGLGKRYRIGATRPAYRTLRDAVSRRGTPAAVTAEERTLWALREVSFSIDRGEAVGVIGHNGAGKTTLLKILSRVTAPSEGEARVRGRVGSLLEVGTGFHPELTGRENIFMNGAILGMRRAEIAAKFDDIVAFAEVERFVDTPVKRYSSGMYVRLAFAVAAHLETEILLVDEVLSVGDFGFQRRSLGKMREQTSAEGRTVLFVSHNLGAVKLLTERCIWLDGGRVRDFGPTEQVFRDYVLSYGEGSGGAADLADGTTGRPSALPQEIGFERVELLAADGRSVDTFLEGDALSCRVRLRARRTFAGERLELVVRVYTLEGVLVCAPTAAFDDLALDEGVYETSFALDPSPLLTGSYTLELYAVTMSEVIGDKAQDIVSSALTFRVEENPTVDGVRYSRRRAAGLVRVGADWSELEPAADVTLGGRH